MNCAHHKRLLAMVLWLMPTTVHALDTSNPQDYPLDFLTRDFYNYSTVSAHVTDMFRYGEFQTSLFAGRLQVSVPIYIVNDPDFKMDIALYYNAEGFKPRKHSGYVGYNWLLESGGCITREVNGYPDEIIGHTDHYKNYTNGTPAPQNYPGIEGMYHYISQHPDVGNIDIDDVFELPLAPESQACHFYGESWHNVGDGCDYEVDYMPDIFHFDFLGHKGSFMIDNTGKVKIVSGDYVEVDLSGILADWEPRYPDKAPNSSFPMYPKENSTVIIRTTDGYTYVFGGDLSKLEYTVNVYNKGSFLPISRYYDYFLLNPPTVNTWHLAKIIAPNGRTATYYYKPAKESEWAGILENFHDSIPGIDDPLWVFNENVNRFYAYNHALSGQYQQIWNKLHAYECPFLASQVLTDYYSSLDYIVSAYMPNGNSYYLHSATKTCILDSINISGDQPLRIIFDNSQESTAMYDASVYGSNSRKNYQLDYVRILSSENIIRTAHLTYNYNGHAGSPAYNWRFLNTVHISGIGYYQMIYNSGTYPDLSGPNPNYIIGTGASNETDDYGYYVGANYNIALLQKIVYPTGGFQTYMYEPYYFNKKRRFFMVGDSAVVMNTATVNNSAAYMRGVRIREIKTYNQTDHITETTLYSYSNGIYWDNLYVYGLNASMYPAYGWPVRFRANYGLSAHIGYGDVIESVTNAQGNTYNTLYHFDMGEDYYTSQTDNDLLGVYPYSNPIFGALTGTMSYSSKLRKWGKLISVKNYDSNNSLLKYTSLEYNDISQISCDTIVTFFHDYKTEMSKKLYVYPDVKTKQITNDYSQGDSLNVTKSYTYDCKLRVKKEMTKDSRETWHFTRHTYPDEVPGAAVLGGTPSPLFIMIHSCRIGRPVESISGYIFNESEFITGGTINLYDQHIDPTPLNWNFPIPVYAVNFRPFLYQTLSLALPEPISHTNYQSMSVSNNTVSYDSRYKLDCEYDFDVMYRPIAVKPIGKIATTYTWDGIYPTSKTIGNQTWIYTHIPHVGVGSITNPRGITTYYSYDQHGRLIEEYQLFNGQKQIFNAYHYHIKTE